jgi:hypothetical protein
MACILNLVRARTLTLKTSVRIRRAIRSDFRLAGPGPPEWGFREMALLPFY